jgi:ribonuclease HI
LARTECFTPLLEVDTGEALGLLTALRWVKDLQLWNMDFEVDSKTVVDSIYGKQMGVSDFNAIINDCCHLLCTDLMNSDVKFIRRQANEAAHSLAREAPSEASFHIFYNIPTCIETILINEMH